MPAPQPPLDAETQHLVNEAARLTARWIDLFAMRLVEEAWDDPAERWQQLHAALARFAAAKTRTEGG